MEAPAHDITAVGIRQQRQISEALAAIYIGNVGNYQLSCISAPQYLTGEENEGIHRWRPRELDLRPLVLIGQELLEDESLDSPDVGMMFWGIAAQCGDAEAMRLAGEQFAIGKVVEQDYDTALLLLRKASLRGDKQAETIIGRIHDVASRRLLRKLSDNADAGDKEAASKRDKVLKLYKHSLLGKHICRI